MLITREQNTGKTVVTVHSLKKGKGRRSVLSSQPSLYSRGQVDNLWYGATLSGLVIKTIAFEVLIFVISFITKWFPSGIFAVLLRFVCAHAGHSKQIKCPHYFKLFSTGKEDARLFSLLPLDRDAMLMTSEYPTVHFDEHITHFCWFVWGLGGVKKRQDSPIAQTALFVFPTLIADS